MVKRRNNPEDIQVIGKAFVEADDSAKLFSGRAEAMKARLKEMAEQIGDKNEDGHSFLMFPEPVVSRTIVRGNPVETTVVGVKREKRTTRFLDEERAAAWLKKHKLWEECTETVTITNVVEDKLWLLVMDDRVSEDDINALYDDNISYALVRVTE